MEENTEVSERVRVAIRVRPRNDREEQNVDNGLQILEASANTNEVYICKKKSNGEVEREMRCSFDCVFDDCASQSEVFDYIQDSVQQVTQGFNCTVFAYGQTGTGKTHTMLGKDVERLFQATDVEQESSAGSVVVENWGVIPRAIGTLFDELRTISTHGSAGVVYLSYMQVYNNDVYDLLRESRRNSGRNISQNHKGKDDEALAVREMIKGNGKHIYVSGLSEFRVTTIDEALRLLRLGNQNRTIRATEYNEKSSRSHAVLQLSVEVESRGVESAATIIRRAKLNLVDLAGSEKWGVDSAMGIDRTKELTSINQSLSALGNVISALTNPRRTHIPYRDSKLTRLLQDSLGGNTRTVVIATISPSITAIEESVSTLQFAERAKCVAVKVRANELVDDAILLAQAQREISRLKLQLKQARSQNPSSALTELQEQVRLLTKENTALKVENQKLRRSTVTLRKSSAEKGAETSPGQTIQQTTPRGSLPVDTRAPSVQQTLALPQRPHSAQLKPRLRIDISEVDHTRREETLKKHEPFTAFGPSWEETQRLEAAEATERHVLETIQAERRALEQQLESISQQELTAQHSTSRNGGVSDQNPVNDEEDLCPICQRDIDDHNDDELDLCIELEAQQKKQQVIDLQLSKQQPATRVGSCLPDHHTSRPIRSPQPPSNQARGSMGIGPRTAALPRQTSRKSSSSSVAPSLNKDPSPYAQDMALKPQTSSSSSSIRATSSHRIARVQSREEAAEARGASFGSERASGSSDNQDDNTQRMEPIIRQGHKSVRALKQLHAISPYSVASSKTQKDRLVQMRRDREDPVKQPGIEGSKSASGISNSVRDIGLRLSVYKFRYDCWYPCTIVGFDNKRRMHCCQYDSGDKQWQDLGSGKFQVLSPSSDAD